jgi:hypothetical protein
MVENDVHEYWRNKVMEDREARRLAEFIGASDKLVNAAAELACEFMIVYRAAQTKETKEVVERYVAFMTAAVLINVMPDFDSVYRSVELVKQTTVMLEKDYARNN